jgi:SAM-dependent methyltransferase
VDAHAARTINRTPTRRGRSRLTRPRYARTVRDIDLAETFDEVPELYDRARPRYPEALFDDLTADVGLGPGSRVLEIGPGTGQATAPIVARGATVVAVEQGPGLSAFLRSKFAANPLVSVETARFEDWLLPADPFDLVVSATAFHWIDPDLRLSKTALALRPGGHLATIATEHVAGGDVPFFEEVQACYMRWDPSTQPGIHLQNADDVPSEQADLDASGRFGDIGFRRYEVEIAYSTATYLDLLMTYSGHRALIEEAQTGLLTCVAELMDRDYGGQIRKRYLFELRTARRT